MAVKKISYVRQIWCAIKYAVQSHVEWQDAKSWASEYHPVWLDLATRARDKYIREEYKQKILLAYRGYEYV